MVEYPAKRNPRRCPVHPGAVLREDMLPASGKTKVEIARLLGISRQHLHDIMEEKKPLSPEVAVRVGKLFGGGAGIWVRMQACPRHLARGTDGGRQPYPHVEGGLSRPHQCSLAAVQLVD
ncbi:addiction module HigA family antidote [Bradyrhizobium sp. LM6.11]